LNKLKLKFQCIFLLYFIIYRIVGYRKSIVIRNIQYAFPHQSKTDQKKLTSLFYKHFAKMIIDTFWVYDASPDDIKETVTIKNMEVFEEIYSRGENATILLSHMGNWELFCQWAALFIPKLNIVTLYQPIKNKFIDQFLIQKRSRFGVKMISTQNTFELIKSQIKYKPAIFLFAIDQNPGDPYHQIWLDFFGKSVPVISGPEKFAKTRHQDVYFLNIHFDYTMNQYQLELSKVDYDPTLEGDLTKKQMKYLEHNIISQPELWLWSHNRFKYAK